MKYSKIIFLFFISVWLLNIVKAQSLKQAIKNGDNFMEYDQFKKAVSIYEKILDSTPNNTHVKYNLGRAYLQTYRPKEGLEQLLASVKLNAKVDKHQEYWLGRAYHLNSNFDAAITHYNSYLTSLSNKDPRRKDLEKFVFECNNGKKLNSLPTFYQIVNVGESINTELSEHSPVLTQDGKRLLFTARKYNNNDNTEDPTKYTEQILVSSKDKQGNWLKPIPFEYNSDRHDATIQLFENDTKLLIYRDFGAGNLYISKKLDSEWGEPQPINELNTQWTESDGFISKDGQTIIYASAFESNNAEGTTDLYISKLGKNGKWGTPLNLGSNINTPYSERSPFLSQDGKTLYFSSEGHNSIGGFDVFKSELVDGAWSSPVSLGLPINTPYDDTYFYFHNDNQWSGYFASYRENGFGEKDIYKVDFVPSLNVSGKIYEQKNKLIDQVTLVEFYDAKTNDLVSFDYTDIETGEYSVTLLPQKSYFAYLKDTSSNLLIKIEIDIPALSKLSSQDFDLPFFINNDNQTHIVKTSLHGLQKNEIITEEFHLVGFIQDAEYPISPGKVKLYESIGKNEYLFESDEDGYFSFDLNPEVLSIILAERTDTSLIEEEHKLNLKFSGKIRSNNDTNTFIKITLFDLLKNKKDVKQDVNGYFDFEILESTPYYVTFQNREFNIEVHQEITILALSLNNKLNQVFFIDNYTHELLELVLIDGQYTLTKGEKKSIISTPNSKKELELSHVLATLKENKWKIKDVKKINSIYYAYNSSIISKGDIDQLNEFATTLSKLNNVTLKITSHADSRGKFSFNKTITNKRNASVENIFLKKGLSPKTLKKQSKSSEECDKVCSNCSEEEFNQFRRTDIEIISY